MSSHEKDAIRDSVFEALETSLEAQLRAIRKLRGSAEDPAISKKGMSQIEMAYDILNRAGEPLHITEIIKRIETIHHTNIDRESLASAITKKLKREDRFIRTDKNTFGIKQR